MARKPKGDPDPQPSDPPAEVALEAETEAPSEGVRYVCAECSFTGSRSAVDGHRRVHAPRRGGTTRPTTDDLESDPEIFELRRAIRVQTLQGQLERASNPPAPRDDGSPPSWARDLVDAMGKIADRLQDGRTSQPAPDPVALASSMVQVFSQGMAAAQRHPPVQESLRGDPLAAKIDAMQRGLDDKKFQDALGGVYGAVQGLEKKIAEMKAPAQDPNLQRDVTMMSEGFKTLQMELANISSKTDRAMLMLSPLVRKIANEPAPPQRVDTVDISDERVVDAVERVAQRHEAAGADDQGKVA